MLPSVALRRVRNAEAGEWKQGKSPAVILPQNHARILRTKIRDYAGGPCGCGSMRCPVAAGLDVNQPVVVGDAPLDAAVRECV